MSLNVILFTIFLSVLPVSELRGAIIYASLLNQMPVLYAFIISVIANALVAPLLFIFLSTLHKLLLPWKFYNNLFTRFVERARTKIHKAVEKYGFWGITIFVAIPFPLTGAYTGALGAWILGMDKWKSILACTVGVLISGTVVSTVVYFGPEVFGFIYNWIVRAPVNT